MKRNLIYCPEINASSVVLLFVKGDSGASWSIRDYSQEGSVKVRYAREFGFDLKGLTQRIKQSVTAPTASTNDLNFWHRLTLQTNEEFALHDSLNGELAPTQQSRSDQAAPKANHYPLLHPEKLMSLPKSRKPEDMRRILLSPNSEDWVTWNAFAAVEELAPNTWWRHFVALAKNENPSLIMLDRWEEQPEVSFWKCITAPREYESASRARMRESGNSEFVSRSEKPGPVEGESEIDISIRNKSLTLIVEAKLGSDISLRTTYDPDRNQIVRNIDCLLDDAGNTAPMFWMLVRDAGAGRSYRQLLHLYREHPSKLADALPHRNELALNAIAQRLSIVLWKDFLKVIPEPQLGNGLLSSVCQELMARVG